MRAVFDKFSAWICAFIKTFNQFEKFEEAPDSFIYFLCLKRLWTGFCALGKFLCFGWIFVYLDDFEIEKPFWFFVQFFESFWVSLKNKKIFWMVIFIFKLKNSSGQLLDRRFSCLQNVKIDKFFLDIFFSCSQAFKNNKLSSIC